MKGLFLKDIKLLMVQKKFLLIVFAFAVIMAFVGERNGFWMGYLSFVMPFFAIGTVSYDEFDNGNAFLFTLPVTRSLYVLEKYAFGLLLCVLSQGVSLCLAALSDLLRQTESLGQTLGDMPGMFGVVVLFLSVMLPLQLKFGAEKGRIAMFVGVGSIAGLGLGLSKLAEWKGIDPYAWVASVMQMDKRLLLLFGIVGVAALLVLSVLVSINIMKRKEM